MVKGSRFDSWRSCGLAAQAVRIHQKRGVDELCLLDVGATPDGRGPDLSLVEELSEVCFMPLAVGGGVRTKEDVRALLKAGADKVVIGTAAFDDRRLVREVANWVGRQALVVAIDVTLGRIATHCGKRVRDTQPVDGVVAQAIAVEELGAGEILLTSIDREGAMVGYDLDMIRLVSKAVDIPVIAHGGCSGYGDMVDAVHAGASAVAAGALFQWTEATPKEAACYLKHYGIETRC